MKTLVLLGLIFGVVTAGYAGTISRTNYTAGQAITAALQNSNENTIVTEINGALDSSNISDGSLTGSDMANLTITNGNIADNTIEVGKFSTVLQSSITLMEVVSTTQTITGGRTFVSSITVVGKTNLKADLQANGSSGNSGDFLTSGGSGAAPAYVAATTVGTYVLVASATASGSSSITFSNLPGATYSAFEVIVDQVIPATDAQDLAMTLSTGSGFLVTGYRYQNARFVSNSVAADGSTSASAWATNGNIEHLGNSTNESFSGRVMVYGANNVVPIKYATWQGSWLSATPSYVGNTGAGEVDTNSAVIDGIKFVMTSGNITSGSFRVYGIKR